MLKRIKIEDLKEGMVFSEPLLFDDGKNKVLGRNAPVTSRELEVLKTWDVPFVMTEGKVISQDNLSAEEFFGVEIEELDTLSDEKDVKNTKAAEGTIAEEKDSSDTDILQLPEILINGALYTEYLSIIQSLDSFLNDLKQKKPVFARPVDGLAVKIHNLLMQDKDLVVSFILSAAIPDREMAKNLVDSAILIEVITRFLKLPDDFVMEMVIAALLHDCGMLRVPEKILQKKEALTDTEMQAVAAHTIYGYKAILSEFMYTERIAIAVLQHHERWDGRGYPSGLNKDSISIGGRILSVIDAFVAMTSAKVYRKPLLGYEAMKTLLADKGRRFDYEVIKAIIQTLGIYPIGSIVLMNDTSIARVVKTAPEAPLRPVIRILIDEEGTHFPNNTGELYDLREHKNTFIVRSIDMQAYQK